jgi:limonene-1,2-epoxide hydrolase
MANTEIVLNFIAAWNRMDWDAVIGALAKDVVYDNIPMETSDYFDLATFTSQMT